MELAEIIGPAAALSVGYFNVYTVVGKIIGPAAAGSAGPVLPALLSQGTSPVHQRAYRPAINCHVRALFVNRNRIATN